MWSKLILLSLVAGLMSPEAAEAMSCWDGSYAYYIPEGPPRCAGGSQGNSPFDPTSTTGLKGDPSGSWYYGEPFSTKGTQGLLSDDFTSGAASVGGWDLGADYGLASDTTLSGGFNASDATVDVDFTDFSLTLDDSTPTVVPEPTPIALLAVGLLGLPLIARRRRLPAAA